jgi:hypothetical protein
MPRDAQFADNENVEGGVECRRHLVCDGYATSREREYDQITAPDEVP